jgi:esterase/lipase superfamily enzyme/lysophospholipase L1-like esterase
MVAGSEPFENEILTFERETVASGGIVLFGSSTIRLWGNAAEDLAPLRVLNRGFGGSTLRACDEAFERILGPLEPDAVVIYAGDNDLDQGARVEELVAGLRSILKKIRARAVPCPPVCVVAIKPSPARWGNGVRIRQANRAIEEECHLHENVWFLDILPEFLDGDLRPRRRLFSDDLLHLSTAGYAIFADAVRRWLTKMNFRMNLSLDYSVEAPASPLLPRTLRLYKEVRTGQVGGEIKRAYHVWHSPALGREMELLVFGHGGERMLVFPSRMERFYEWENRGMIHAAHDALASGRVQFWCVDSIDAESFFAFDRSPAERIGRHYQFEKYVLSEVLPLTERLNPGSSLGAVGCSLGAFHAAAIAFRHPHLFKRLLAMSGRFDLSYGYGNDYPDLFHGYRDLPLYFLMPNQFLANLRDAAVLAAMREMEILFAVGESDVFRHSNEELSHTLSKLGVSHHLKLWVGQAHRFRVWRQMARQYF